MNFKLSAGEYKSIKSLQWNDIPKFVVVTGKNGSGKTQLLELLNHHFGTEQQHKNNIARQPANPFHGVKTTAEDCNISVKELVYLPSIWQLGNLGATNASKFTEIINKLYNQITTAGNEAIYQELATIVEGNIGKPKGQITKNDIQEHLPVDYFDYINKIKIHEGLSEAFLAYHCKYAELRDEGKSETEIVSELDQPPWDVINSLLKSADFPYMVNKPKAYMGDYHFELISRKDNNLIINFSDLSSGEKVLISLGIWMFNTSKAKRLPKLLLLDEPDAHLHPSAIKDFITVIEDVLVKKHDVRVILTTHSPSTVSLSPEYALFEMSQDSPQIKPLKSKEYGINLLTEGLIVIKSNIKYVLVEDRNDSKYYNEVFKILKTKGKIKQSVDIVFIPASNKSAGTSGGCTVVRAWVEKFINEGADDIFQGLMDYDNGTNIPESITATTNLHVVDRYSLENYLLDPILIFASLLHENSPPTISGISMTQKDEHKVSKLQTLQLQKIADYFFQEIEPLVNGLTAVDKKRIDVSFITRRKLKYPSWFLNKRGHTLHGLFKSKFKKGVDYDKLINAMIRQEFIPNDLVKTFKELQN